MWSQAWVSASQRHSAALPLRARFHYLKIRANAPIDFSERDTFDIMRSSRARPKHSVAHAQRRAECVARSARHSGAARARSQTGESHAYADGVPDPGAALVRYALARDRSGAAGRTRHVGRGFGNGRAIVLPGL